MTLNLMPQAEIDRLNARAKVLIDADEDEYGAYQIIARCAGLTYVGFSGGAGGMEGTTAGPQCEIWRDGDGRYVNLWIVGDSLGFDDQVSEEDLR